MSNKLKKQLVETDVDELHKVSEEVDLNDTRLCRFLEKELMSVYVALCGKCQGLSAIQCGYAYRAVLLRWERGTTPIVAYNPKVLKSFGKKKSIERCLSEKDIPYKVKRPLLVKVSYYTRFKEEVVIWLPYKKARIFMHEYDHLDGILLQDKGVRI